MIVRIGLKLSNHAAGLDSAEIPLVVSMMKPLVLLMFELGVYEMDFGDVVRLHLEDGNFLREIYAWKLGEMSSRSSTEMLKDKPLCCWRVEMLSLRSLEW